MIMEHPLDIVLIVLDTQRADHLSCYGYPLETSPHLDVFAANATRFTQAISTAQWTVPAHASMFTGLYPSQHTMSQIDSVLPPALPTLAERLRQVGYFTAAFSNNPLIGAKNNGLQRGFDKILNFSSIDLGLWVAHLEETKTSGNFLAGYRRNLRHLLARILGYGETGPPSWLSGMLGPFIEGFLKFKGGSKDDNARRSLTAALDLLINRHGVAPHQPVFTFINLMGTHTPYAPPRWAMEQFLSPAIGKRPTRALLQRANSIGLDVNNWLETELPKEEYKALLSGMYDAEVAAQDAQLGYFFRGLREVGALERTLLIIASDHGDHLGEKRRISHLFGAYQELVRVPLIIRDPRSQRQGQTFDTFVSIRRLYHTALAATGKGTPSESELSLMREEVNRKVSDSEHDVAFVEAETPAWVVKRLAKRRPGLVEANGYDGLIRAIYSDAHKLIVKSNNLTELYAIRDDPEEKQNLSLTLPEKVDQMLAELQNFIQRTRPTVTPIIHLEEDPAMLMRLRDLGYLE